MTEPRRSSLPDVARIPEEFAARYRAAGHWRDQTIDAFWREQVAASPDRRALVGAAAADRKTLLRLTYAEVEAAARRAAALLAENGVEPGDRVLVHLPNCVDHVVALLASWRLGALPVFTLPAHRAGELDQFCAAADPAAIVLAGTGWGADPLAEVAAVDHPLAVIDAAQWRVFDDDTPTTDVPGSPAHGEDVAFLQLSGGTTGTPKLIPRTHADYLYSVRESAAICGLTESSVLLVAIPAAHNFPMSSPGILGVIHAGGATVIAPDPAPRTSFALIESERVTHTSLVPPLLQGWLASSGRNRFDLSSLAVVGVGGAKLAEQVAVRVRPELGAQLQQVFGMAEGLVCYTRLDDPDELVVGCQGRPISPDDEIRVVDDGDRDVPDGEEGQLLTRGPYTIRGYLTGGEDSFTADGFYRTGDLVRRLPGGNLVVTGRAKDQINRGGEKIAVDEIEGLLLADPRVSDAVLVGLPDRMLGEKSCAVVVAPGLAPGDISALLRAHRLAAHKLPDRVVLVDTLPTTGVGKNSRRELRTQLALELQEN